MLDSLNKFLAELPLATLLGIGAIVGGIIALADGSIDYQEFLLGIGASTAGAGALGYARVKATEPSNNSKGE